MGAISDKWLTDLTVHNAVIGMKLCVGVGPMRNRLAWQGEIKNLGPTRVQELGAKGSLEYQ